LRRNRYGVAVLFWMLALAALAVVALGARRLIAGYPPAAFPARVLAPRELATIAAAAQATFPRGGAIPPSGLDAGIPAFVDRFVAAQQPATRTLMRLLFALVEHATLLFPAPGGPGRRRRFSSLDAPQQVQVLDGWRTSRLFPRRLVFTSLRAILTMGYFADPAVLRQLGLAPRAIPRRVCEADLLWPRIGAPRSAIAYTTADLSPDTAIEALGPTGTLHPDFAAPEPSAPASSEEPA
jgi:hypothetical protein